MMHSDQVISIFFQLKRCPKWPAFSISTKTRRFSMVLYTFLNVFSLMARMPHLVLVLASFTSVETHGTKVPSYISITSTLTESNLANAEGRESVLLFLSNYLESFAVSASIWLRRNEKKHHAVELSCLPDSFKVMETHRMGESFRNSVP